MIMKANKAETNNNKLINNNNNTKRVGLIGKFSSVHPVPIKDGQKTVESNYAGNPQRQSSDKNNHGNRKLRANEKGKFEQKATRSPTAVLNSSIGRRTNNTNEYNSDNAREAGEDNPSGSKQQNASGSSSQKKKTSSANSEISYDNSKWTFLRSNIPRIIKLGMDEGILEPRKPKFMEGIEVDETETDEDGKKVVDDLQIEINDVSLMHEAIPFLPVPLAAICMLFNFTLPGTGTMLSGLLGLCFGRPRIQLKDGRRSGTFFVNFGVGLSQTMTVTFMLVGWFWSIAWGGLLIIHSLQYREALNQRRQEEVATAAIEALTKDSVLHRRDVKNLVGGKGKDDSEAENHKQSKQKTK